MYVGTVNNDTSILRSLGISVLLLPPLRAVANRIIIIILVKKKKNKSRQSCGTSHDDCTRVRAAAAVDNKSLRYRTEATVESMRAKTSRNDSETCVYKYNIHTVITPVVYYYYFRNVGAYTIILYRYVPTKYIITEIIIIYVHLSHISLIHSLTH